MGIEHLTKDDFNDFKDELFERLDGRYVSKTEFSPVKSIVYGMVGLILTGVTMALVAQVVKAFL